MNYADGGTRQIYYCFHSGHRQSGQPPRTKESSESPQRLATILHHGILNLMFNAVNHPPSQIHIHSHTVARSFSDPFTVERLGQSKCHENIFSYRSVLENNKSINNLSESIRIIILILISLQQLSFEQALSKMRIC